MNVKDVLHWECKETWLAPFPFDYFIKTDDGIEASIFQVSERVGNGFVSEFFWRIHIFDKGKLIFDKGLFEYVTDAMERARMFIFGIGQVYGEK